MASNATKSFNNERKVKSAGTTKTQTRPSNNQNSNSKSLPRVTTAPATRTVKHAKPSDRLNPKTVDPFNKKIQTSVFAAAYSKGSVPCCLVHGSVKNSLQWRTPPEELNFDPVLVLFAEGLKETIHPYSFVANEGFRQLLASENAEAKLLPILPKLITPIKAALLSPDDKCFSSTLQALVDLSNATGPAFNSYLKNVLPQISRRMNNKTLKEEISIALERIECNGGSECTSTIKSRVPTYSSVL